MTILVYLLTFFKTIDAFAPPSATNHTLGICFRVVQIHKLFAVWNIVHVEVKSCLNDIFLAEPRVVVLDWDYVSFSQFTEITSAYSLLSFSRRHNSREMFITIWKCLLKMYLLSSFYSLAISLLFSLSLNSCILQAKSPSFILICSYHMCGWALPILWTTVVSVSVEKILNRIAISISVDQSA